MTKSEMLDKLGTTAEVFDSYRRKASKYIADLTPEELAIQKKIQPPSKPAQFLGAEVTPDELSQLISEDSPIIGVFTSNAWGRP